MLSLLSSPSPIIVMVFMRAFSHGLIMFIDRKFFSKKIFAIKEREELLMMGVEERGAGETDWSH